MLGLRSRRPREGRDSLGAGRRCGGNRGLRRGGGGIWSSAVFGLAERRAGEERGWYHGCVGYLGFL